MAFEVCEDEGIPRLKLGGDDQLQQCCNRGWFAGVYAAAWDPYYELHDVTGLDNPGVFDYRRPIWKVISVRGDGQNGDVVTVALNIKFYAEDPDDPYVDPDNPGSTVEVESTLTIDLTTGYDSAGAFEYKGTFSGGTVSYEGSLGTPATADNPVVEVWVNSFGYQAANYRAALEYAVPTATPAITGSVDFLDFLAEVGYPIQWQDAADAARALFDPDFEITLDGFRADSLDIGAQRFGSAYAMDSVYQEFPDDKLHSFNQPRFPAPTTKRTDEPFLIELKLYNIYRKWLLDPSHDETVFTIADADLTTIPETLLVNTTEGQVLYMPPATYAPGMFIGLTAFGGDFGYQYLYDGCYFLAKAGIHQIKSRSAVDPLSGGGSSIGIADFWWYYTSFIKVTRSAAYCYRVHQFNPDEVDRTILGTQPVCGSVPQGDDGSGPAPLEVRIADFAGAQLDKEWNLIEDATNHVEAALEDLGGNFHPSPGLDGTIEKDCVAGVASFDALKVIGLGRNYELKFMCAPFDYSESHGPPLNPAPGDALHKVPMSIACDLRINDPGPQVAGVAFDIVVDIVDADGNILDPTTADDLTLSDDGSFTGSGTQAPVSGTTTFSGNCPTPGTYEFKVKTSRAGYDGPNDDSGDIPSASIMVTVS